nr:Fis family transcriptional regulator [Sulfurospirillum tamanensis]
MSAAEVMEKTMAEVAVDHTNFIARSRASLEALKSANLLKSLNINALILGEQGVGKTTLATHIVQAPIVAGEHAHEVLKAVESNSKLIIKNFDKLGQFHLLKELLAKHNTRIIATTSGVLSDALVDEFFSLKITLTPLRERPEDINPLIDKFFLEIRKVFNADEKQRVFLKDFVPDLSENGYSLRRSVYTTFLASSFGENEILLMMQNYLKKKIGTGNDYRDLLYLFDVPLIKAGHDAFGSQLAMAEKFGLNRNTLRKKISEYGHYLEGKEKK